MNNTFMLILFVLFGFALLANPVSVFAASVDASLWVPQQILPDQTYQGLIVVKDNSDKDIVFDIITNNDEVINIVNEKITIPKGQHHGVITFETKATGDAQIFAIYKDVLLEQTINVEKSASMATELDLILPSDVVNVLATDDKITGYVFLINKFENPVTVDYPVTLALTSNGEITLPKNSVVIEPGNHYAKFVFNARGSGSITANAPNLEPDEETLTISTDDAIELNLAVAPDPIPTDSSAEIYFWLERDGRPYLVPHDVKVTITIDKSSNLSFDSAMEGAIVLTPNTKDRKSTESEAKSIITRTEVQLKEDSKRTVTLTKGSYYGKLTAYATYDSTSSIRISGLAESVNTQQNEETIKESEIITVSTESSTETSSATETRVYAYPNPAYDKVEIIVSSYSGDGPVIERDNEPVSVFTSNELALERSQTIISSDSNYAIITATVNDVGTADIFAERNEAESDEITIQTLGKYVKQSRLSITPLPVIFGVEQDLFLVTSAHDRITTDPDSSGDDVLVSITSKPSFPFTTTLEGESIITAKGTIAYLSEDTTEGPRITVASNADTATEQLEVYNPTRRTIIFDIPRNVFPEEPFPIVNHVADLENNPIQIANLKISSSAEMSLIDNLVYINETGSHKLIFYDHNTVPVEASITVEGATSRTTQQQQQSQESQITVVTYNIEVEEGSGSGTYEEDEEVTISAPETRNDNFIIKEKLVGWENLPYKEPEVTFFADSNLETKPIYETDYTMLFTIIGPAAGIGAFIFIKKQKSKNNPEDTDELSEEDMQEMDD